MTTVSRSKLPPGPRLPAPLQMLGMWTRPVAFAERNRARYGKRFTMHFPGLPPFVVHSEPEHIKEIFSAPPEVLHPGEGAKILEPVVGSHSVILLDEGPHLQQRKLMLPAFHGERMKALSGRMEEVAERHIASWPLDEAIETHPRFQDLTMEIIMRAVFGVDPGSRFDQLRTLLAELLAYGEKPSSMVPPLQQPIFKTFRDFHALHERIDQLIFELIAERRGEEADGDDVLAMFLTARHEDGSPMSDEELRDELITMLVAGHETTASELAWAVERLVREPQVLKRLTAEVDAGNDDAYLTATIQEVLRRRPVLQNAEPRLVKQEVEIGGWTYPPDVALIASAYLLHHDPDIYPDPYAFTPERFLDEQPGTYTWIPFGGGRRRCIGASFAMLEMGIALRALLRQRTLEPASGGLELTRRRQITVSPRLGAPAVLHARDAAPRTNGAKPTQQATAA